MFATIVIVIRFLPSRVASQAITKCIKQQFLEPWSTWGVIPDSEKEHFWNRFKVQYLFIELYYTFTHFIFLISISFLNFYSQEFNGCHNMKVKLREIFTIKHLIDSLRCLEKLEMQGKGQNGLEKMCGAACKHIGILYCIVTNVLEPKKIEHLKRVEAYTQAALSPHMNMPFDWYIKSIYLSILFI